MHRAARAEQFERRKAFQRFHEGLPQTASAANRSAIVRARGAVSDVDTRSVPEL
jgi:hypothetical protein